MRSIQKLPRRSGRKAKNPSESRFSHYYVEGRENRESGSAEEKNTMTKQTKLGGNFTLPGTSTSLCRMGYGAMQLAGPEVWAFHGTLTLRLLFCERPSPPG